MSTIRFGRTERERDPVLATVAKLPGSVEPGRDLWPEIRSRIAHEAPGAQPVKHGLSLQWAMAAGVAVASVSVLFTWMALQPAEREAAQRAGTQPTAVAALADDPASRLLNQLLLSTYRDEINLYSSVAATAGAAGRRT